MSLATVIPTVEADATMALQERLRLAEAKVMDLERDLRLAKADADQMARAWQRELGGPFVAKTHWIDAMVLTTRDRMESLQKLRTFAKHCIDYSGEGSLRAMAMTALESRT